MAVTIYVTHLLITLQPAFSGLYYVKVKVCVCVCNGCAVEVISSIMDPVHEDILNISS